MHTTSYEEMIKNFSDGRLREEHFALVCGDYINYAEWSAYENFTCLNAVNYELEKRGYSTPLRLSRD